MSKKGRAIWLLAWPMLPVLAAGIVAFLVGLAVYLWWREDVKLVGVRRP